MIHRRHPGLLKRLEIACGLDTLFGIRNDETCCESWENVEYQAWKHFSELDSENSYERTKKKSCYWEGRVKRTAEGSICESTSVRCQTAMEMSFRL